MVQYFFEVMRVNVIDMVLNIYRKVGIEVIKYDEDSITKELNQLMKEVDDIPPEKVKEELSRRREYIEDIKVDPLQALVITVELMSDVITEITGDEGKGHIFTSLILVSHPQVNDFMLLTGGVTPQSLFLLSEMFARKLFKGSNIEKAKKTVKEAVSDRKVLLRALIEATYKLMDQIARTTLSSVNDVVASATMYLHRLVIETKKKLYTVDMKKIYGGVM